MCDFGLLVSYLKVGWVFCLIWLRFRLLILTCDLLVYDGDLFVLYCVMLGAIIYRLCARLIWCYL